MFKGSNNLDDCEYELEIPKDEELMSDDNPRLSIVREDELLSENAILKEQWRLFKILMMLGDEDDNYILLQWLAARKLIKNSYKCKKCGMLSRIIRRSAGDGYFWFCWRCCKQTSVREGSFFSGPNPSLKCLLLLVYFWCHGLEQKAIAHEVNMSEESTALWSAACRNVCEAWMEINSAQIGGFKEDWQPKVVEVDESPFFEMRSESDKWEKGHWVFGGTERGSGKSFLVDLPNREDETLENALVQYVLPGSIIVSNASRNYIDFEQIAGGIYMHDVICNESGLRLTNTSELMWDIQRRKIQKKYGEQVPLNMSTSCLHEFLWRYTFRRKNMFAAFIACLSTIHNVNESDRCHFCPLFELC